MNSGGGRPRLFKLPPGTRVGGGDQRQEAVQCSDLLTSGLVDPLSTLRYQTAKTKKYIAVTLPGSKPRLIQHPGLQAFCQPAYFLFPPH